MSEAVASFHAPVYDDAPRRDRAAALRAEPAEGFAVDMGLRHGRPIGPHPEPFCRVACGAGEFAAAVQWLMRHRRGLAVLLHPETGGDPADHSEHAIWMGRLLPLGLEVFRGAPA